MASRIEGTTPAQHIEQLPDSTPEVHHVFEMVTSRALTVAPRHVEDIPPREFFSLSPEEMRDTLLFSILRTFTCFRMSGVTPFDILNEAIEKRQPRVVRAFMHLVTNEQLGISFTMACTQDRYLDIAEMILNETEISPAAVGKGFEIVCDFGNINLAALFKWHSKLSQQDLDAGYLKAYHSSKGEGFQVRCNTTMETISERVSPEMLGKVFILACKDGRKDFARNQVKNPRLKTADLQRGLAIAAQQGFVHELKSEMSTMSLVRLYAYNKRAQFFMGSLVTAATVFAGFTFFKGVNTPIPISKTLEASLRMVSNLDVLENAERCCSLSTRLLSQYSQK
jgi:hypothetical protein